MTLAAITLDPCETVQHDRYEGETLTPDALLSDVQASDYDLLVVPGGTCNVDHIRVNEDAITLAQEFAHEGKPIAAICHGAWLLVNAGPQAPSMSWPRVSRRVAVMPARCRISRNCFSSSGLEAVHFEPSIGFSGIGLT